MKKLTHTDFILKSKKIHGNKYNYPMEYIKSKVPLLIVCKKHNFKFYQTPNDHLSGCGCPKCGKENKGLRLSNEDFIKKANKIHNNKYKYIEEYIKSDKKIKINCPIHDNFEMRPNDHLMGHGCPKCGGTYSNITDFFKRCKVKHNNKYSYDYSTFKNQKSTIKINCPEHGWVELIARNHLNGSICPKCSNKYRYKNINDFSIKANQVHNNKYKYVGKYINNHTHITIICPEHGEFKMRPYNHISGKNGCPKCKNKNARLRRIEEISKNKFKGSQVIPSYNSNGCEILDIIAKKNKTYIQHAMNEGEFFIKELGYWVDGYDKDNNIVYEIDEKYHFNKNGSLRQKDIERQKEIVSFLKCKFIRIKYDEEQKKMNKK